MCTFFPRRHGGGEVLGRGLRSLKRFVVVQSGNGLRVKFHIGEGCCGGNITTKSRLLRETLSYGLGVSSVRCNVPGGGIKRCESHLW